MKDKIEMARYYISSAKSKHEYVKKFKTDEACYQWIVNTLDLSLEWAYKRI